MAVTVKDIKALMERTGVGMMDCKRALVETDGDAEKAIEIHQKLIVGALIRGGERAKEFAVYDIEKIVHGRSFDIIARFWMRFTI